MGLFQLNKKYLNDRALLGRHNKKKIVAFSFSIALSWYVLVLFILHRWHWYHSLFLYSSLELWKKALDGHWLSINFIVEDTNKTTFSKTRSIYRLRNPLQTKFYIIYIFTRIASLKVLDKDYSTQWSYMIIHWNHSMLKSYSGIFGVYFS